MEVFSVGTRIQAGNRSVFTALFKLTPFEGSALWTPAGELGLERTPRQAPLQTTTARAIYCTVPSGLA
jgi:hypothetical protein